MDGQHAFALVVIITIVLAVLGPLLETVKWPKFLYPEQDDTE